MTGVNSKIAVFGAGSWGTALALVLSRNGLEVALWGRPEEVALLRADRQNSRYLPGVPFPERLQPTENLSEALSGASDLLIAVPSGAFAEVIEQLRDKLQLHQGICWATKGLEPHSGEPLSTLTDHLPGEHPTAVLSGPTFAGEVARGLPTAMTIASDSQTYANRIAGHLHSDCFRAYTSDDMIGVQVGGAVKNVMAIGAGIVDGLGFGANARAALITRGQAEITRLGCAMGARPETFMGLAGIGDLVLTCTDDQSRNRRMGLALARGSTIEQAQKTIGQAVEGVKTTRVVYQRARSLQVEMPITEQIYRVLYEGKDPKTAVKRLLERAQKAENTGF